MTRTLILMRHAKSAWADPGAQDFDRPLNKRGRQSATVLGDWLRARDHRPDDILCSAARRTVETCEGLAMDAPVTQMRELYLADAETMLAALHKAKGATVAMIGHNPDIGGFAADLVAEAPDHPRFADYPTGATLVARFDIDTWADLRMGTGRAVDFTVPRDLTD